MIARPGGASTAQLSTVFTIPQVAKMANWTTSRMRRHLLAKHAELEGALLRNVGRGRKRPRWTITLAALQAIAPQWFQDPEAIQRQVDWLTAELDDARSVIALAAAKIGEGELQRQLYALERRLEAIEQRLRHLDTLIDRRLTEMTQRRAS